MTSIDVYRALDTWVPASLSVLLILAVVIAVVLGYSRKKQFPQFFLQLLQINFPDIQTEKGNKRDVHVEGKTINTTAVFILLLCVLPLTLGSVFVTFWNVFLVEEEVRGDCVPNFDCYPFRDDTQLQKLPVGNCSSSEVDGDLENVRYECYRFVFDYAQGVGAAGGVLLFTSIFSKLYFSAIVTVMSLNQSKTFKRITMALVWLSMGIVFLLFVVLNTAILRVREDMFQTVTSIIQFLMYSVNLFIIVISGVVITYGLI